MLLASAFARTNTTATLAIASSTWTMLSRPVHQLAAEAKLVKLEMTTDLPIGDAATLKIVATEPKMFTIALRRPYWAETGFTVKVNGKTLTKLSRPDSYVEITRRWKPGDTLALVLPKTLRKEPLPDNPNRMAIMWGPLVLAGDLGPEIEEGRFRQDGTPPPPAPALVTAEQRVDGWLKPLAGKPGFFRTAKVGLSNDIEFLPFYELPRRRYAIYWDVFTPAEWAKQSALYAAEEQRKRRKDRSLSSPLFSAGKSHKAKKKAADEAANPA